MLWKPWKGILEKQTSLKKKKLLAKAQGFVKQISDIIKLIHTSSQVVKLGDVGKHAELDGIILWLRR